ncbi:MAG: mercuric reductase [Candidatus Hydrogenedentes bacterium]|nr:mercuric reductase [Candidatus Hydrogenedentota bacterium]
MSTVDRTTMPPMDGHNRELAANVHPPDWVNPRPQPRYNLVVIGAGTAGLVTAAGAAGLGAKVALVERHLMGGDCLNVGCVPSKAIIQSARVSAEVRDAHRFGVQTAVESPVDFAAVMERMRAIRSGISHHDSAERFRALGVDVFFGDARFTSRNCVEVGGQALRFSKAVIATGARPALPDIPGLEAAGYLTNETVFSLTECPSRMLVIGGGPIGCELAQAFQRLGSQVTLVERGDRVLPRDDSDAALVVADSLRRDGVSLVLGASIAHVVLVEGNKRAILGRDGGDRVIDVDAILVASGRRPNVEDLGLESAGVVYESRTGVQVDDFLRTTNPRIYAAGDVCMRYKFTHAAEAAARIVIQNALFGIAGKKNANALTIPWCTYTEPELAQVGLNEQEARDRRIAIDTIQVSMADVDRARTDGETEGFLKVHVKKGSDRILGATLVARHAGDLISEITLAMTAGVGLRTIADVIHPYPTHAEVVKKAADAYNRTRLTPLLKRVLATILRWQR